jgi:hypothetical protein
MIILFLTVFCLNYFIGVLNADYFIRPSGSDNTGCTSYLSTYCQTFQYVMYNLSFGKYIYMQPGNYTYTTTQTISSTYFYVYGATSSTYGEVRLNDLSTYPNITFYYSSSVAQQIYLNQTYCSWYYVKINHGYSSYANNYIFYSFIFILFFLFLFYFLFFFIYSCIK